MKTILAPVDFSSATEAVIGEAARLAKVLPAKVVVLAVIQPPMITSEYAALVDNTGEILAAGEKNAARRLAAIEDQLRQEGITVEAVQAIVRRGKANRIQHVVGRKAEGCRPVKRIEEDTAEDRVIRVMLVVHFPYILRVIVVVGAPIDVSTARIARLWQPVRDGHRGLAE